MITLKRPHKRGNFDCGSCKDNRDVATLRRQRAACLAVAKAVAERFGYTLEQLFSDAKPRELARVRCMAMAIACELSGVSEPETAKAFGRKDHNSTRHAKRVAAELMTDPHWGPVYKETREHARAALPRKEAKP